jgi:hypothetical protein
VFFKTSSKGFPIDPDGNLICKYVAIVAAISVGATGRLIVWAGTWWPAKKMGT